MTRRVRAVLLDAHGTLVTLDPPAPVLAAALGVPGELAERAIAAEIAYYRAHMLDGRDPESVGELRARCAGVLRDALGFAPWRDLTGDLLGALRFRAFPESFAALRSLRAAGMRIVVASNWDSSLPETLDSLGLLELVDGVVTSAGCGSSKPGGELFAAALALAGVRPCEAIHVGDSVAEDVEGARAAGIEPVLMVRVPGACPPRRSGQNPDQNPDPDPDRGSGAGPGAGVRRIASLSELPGLVA